MKKIPVRPNRLTELREQSKLTLKEASKVTGIDPGTIYRHEKCERGLNDESIKAYAQLYKVQTHELFFETEEI